MVVLRKVQAPIFAQQRINRKRILREAYPARHTLTYRTVQAGEFNGMPTKKAANFVTASLIGGLFFQ
jgi:hypothetical protein